MNRLFKVFNVDRTKNEEVTQYTLLEVEINGHKKQINVVVMDLNSMNMFLRYNWLIKHNLEVNHLETEEYNQQIRIKDNRK